MEDKVKSIMAENTAKVVEQVYEDIAQPILKSVGNIVSLPFKAIDAALTPIKKWIDKRNLNYEKTKKLLAKKLENVDESSIVEPESYVAVPALQQLSYSYDSEDLRNMYANLLASSMIDVSKFTVHPSYVDIIRQLSPTDAKALNIIFNPGFVTVVNIRANYTKLQRCKEICNNYSIELENLYFDNFDQSASLLNLERLGIIYIDYDRLVDDQSKYDVYNSSDMLHKAYEQYKDENDVQIEMKKGLIRLTDFGLNFCITCCDTPPEILEVINKQNKSQENK